MSKNIDSELIKYEMNLIMQRLDLAIHESGIPFTDVAYSAGVTPGNLYKYLNGTNVIPFDRFVALTESIGVNRAYIVFGDNVEKCFIQDSGAGDVLIDIKNLKVRIEKEAGGYSTDERFRYLGYFQEIGLLLSKRPCQ